MNVNPGTLENIDAGDEPSDLNDALQESPLDQDTSDRFEFVDIKMEPHYSEASFLSHRTIVKEDAELPKRSNHLLLSTSGEQDALMDVNPGTLENIDPGDEPLDRNDALEQSSLNQETSHHFEFVDIKTVPCYPKASSVSRRTIVKEEAGFPKQRNQLSRKQETSVKLGVKVECDDLKIRRVQPTDPNGKLIVRAETGNKPKQRYRPKGPLLKKSSKFTGKAFRTEANSRDCSSLRALNQLQKCDVCDKAFADGSTLRKHELLNTAQRPHECGTCGQTFFRRYVLTDRVQIHSGKKPHECAVREKAFVTKSLLRKHSSSHSDDKPHECAVCEKAFVTKSLLRKHASTHSSEKPYGCGLCGRAFSRNTHLKAHLLIHSGEKPHECGVCGKTFTVRSTMKKHMLIHSGEKPHKCVICGKAFLARFTMKKHMSIHSKEELLEYIM